MAAELGPRRQAKRGVALSTEALPSERRSREARQNVNCARAVEGVAVVQPVARRDHPFVPQRARAGTMILQGSVSVR
jgi:hypothetical protein